MTDEFVNDVTPQAPAPTNVISTPPPTPAPQSGVPQSVDWEAPYKGLSKTFEETRQALLQATAQAEQAKALPQVIESLKNQMQVLIDANATAQAKIAQAEAAQKEATIKSRRESLLTEKAPNLRGLAEYIPLKEDEEEQRAEVEKFLASMGSVTPVVPASPPASTPSLPTSQDPKTRATQLHNEWWEAVERGDPNAPNLEKQFLALYAQDPTNRWNASQAVTQGAATIFQQIR